MTAFTLKPRQRAARDAVFAKLSMGVARQLVALPTGTGKTVLACDIAREFPRALFLCHRQELVAQTARTMSRLDPDRAQGVIVQGEHRIADFTVGMIQTVHRRLDRLDPTAFDLIVIDEAHHAAARHRLRLRRGVLALRARDREATRRAGEPGIRRDRHRLDARPSERRDRQPSAQPAPVAGAESPRL